MTAYITMSGQRKYKSKLLTWLELIIHIFRIQQHKNGSDCDVFAAAFATSLVYGVPPQLLQFDVPKLGSHLCACLKAEKMEMFPLL